MFMARAENAGSRRNASVSVLYGMLSLVFVLLPFGLVHAGERCSGSGVWVQVLGSGGPEVEDRRASSSYLVWKDGKARLLIDSGGGSALRFGESGARFEDIAAVLFSHMHVDHSADFPALIKSSYFGNRREDLPVLGPDGTDLMPSVVEFVNGLFRSPNGIYRYLSEFLNASSTEAYTLRPRVVKSGENIQVGTENEPIRLTAASVHHGPIPALAWAVEIGGRKLAFSGDMNGSTGHLNTLAKQADILVAHNAVPEGASGAAVRLHMPPSVIGEIAADAEVKHLVLSHRMMRTLGREAETQAAIRRHYSGRMDFANDLDCFSAGGD